MPDERLGERSCAYVVLKRRIIHYRWKRWWLFLAVNGSKI